MATRIEVNLDTLVVQVEGLDLDGNKAGSGAYGCVFGVTVDGKDCIAKKIHNILLQERSFLQRDYILTKFRNECCILSRLNHPNVVSFIGVHYGHDKNDISLIMERLHSDLANFVVKNPDTDLAIRIHILYDVSKGLQYLHSLTPPLIHRDLTAPNVLLTKDLTAKIGDLGVSRYMDPSAIANLTTNPGNAFYMPPECRIERPKYTIKLDIFSFGILIIHTIIGNVPNVYDLSTLSSFFYNLLGKMELKRRNQDVHKKMGKNHCLYSLAEKCLRDRPEQRPMTEYMSRSLRKLCHKNLRMVSGICTYNNVNWSADLLTMYFSLQSFMEACETGIVGVVQLALEGGVDPNQKNEVRFTVCNICV